MRQRYAAHEKYKDTWIGEIVPTKFSISCHKCQNPAAVIELVEQDSKQFSIVVNGFIGNVMAMEIGHKPVDTKLFDEVKTLAKIDLLALHALDPDLFGFICRRCGYAYCVNCWEYIYPTFDEGFYDDTRGTCPQGHEQMLQD